MSFSLNETFSPFKNKVDPYKKKKEQGRWSKIVGHLAGAKCGSFGGSEMLGLLRIAIARLRS